MGRLHNCKVLLWWSGGWGIGIMALAPLVNYLTPFLNSSYANQWTPDIYWRLIMYWHGGIFIPWITVLAVLVCMMFKLDEMAGRSGRLVRESVFIGGFFAVPIAGIAGLFDVYDRFAYGIPLWAQIFAFLIADEMAIALFIAMVNYPRASGKGYFKMGLPYYTIMLGIAGAGVAAVMGHMGGWISWFGPSPSQFSDYISSTVGSSNDTSVIMFTEGAVGGHSHLMLVSLMAGVVGLVGSSLGYYAVWSKTQRAVSRFGYGVMIVALLMAIWIYIVSGISNFAIPSYFVSGLNGVAGDDMITGTVGLGAFFVLIGLVLFARKKTTGGMITLREPLLLSLVTAWVLIYLVIPVTGFWMNFNENYFKGAGLSFDQVFTRYHQDFGFFLLPALVTLVLALNSFGISGSTRRNVGYLLLGGEVTTFVFGEAYALVTANVLALYLAGLGGILMGLGVLVGLRYMMTTKTSPVALGTEVPIKT
jgi:hypothetical protein